MKKTNKKGFTLAELLVVVAIIAVLVAIAIPIFTSQLEKARESTDAANIRSAYAELTSEVLTDGGEIAAKTEGKIQINASKESDATATATITLTQTKADWQDTSIKGSKIGSMDAGTPTAGGTATVTVTKATGAAELTYNKN